MVAAYTVKGASFEADKPRMPSQQIPEPEFAGTTYDAGPDGRVVALIPAEARDSEQSQNQLIFVENFAGELRWRVPDN